MRDTLRRWLGTEPALQPHEVDVPDPDDLPVDEYDPDQDIGDEDVRRHEQHHAPAPPWLR